MYKDLEHLSCNSLALACCNLFRCDTRALLRLPISCVGVLAAAVQEPKHETNMTMTLIWAFGAIQEQSEKTRQDMFLSLSFFSFWSATETSEIFVLPAFLCTLCHFYFIRPLTLPSNTLSCYWFRGLGPGIDGLTFFPSRPGTAK